MKHIYLSCLHLSLHLKKVKEILTRIIKNKIKKLPRSLFNRVLKVKEKPKQEGKERATQTD